MTMDARAQNQGVLDPPFVLLTNWDHCATDFTYTFKSRLGFVYYNITSCTTFYYPYKKYYVILICKDAPLHLSPILSIKCII